jgi:hypothetical protein
VIACHLLSLPSQALADNRNSVCNAVLADHVEVLAVLRNAWAPSSSRSWA